MDIVIASNNPHKIEEMRAILSKNIPDIRLLSLSEAGFTGEIEETGKTLEENALIKAKAAASLGFIAVADDTGLEVDALNGEPGVYSARYAGKGHDNDANNEKLLRSLSGVPNDKRSARFVTVIACVFPDSNETISVRGVCEGKILTRLRGKRGFGYDPLFYYPPLQKTFSQMRAEEKNEISHRARAIKAFASEFKKKIG